MVPDDKQRSGREIVKSVILKLNDSSNLNPEIKNLKLDEELQSPI